MSDYNEHPGFLFFAEKMDSSKQYDTRNTADACIFSIGG
jgi:hypothetical protein